LKIMLSSSLRWSFFWFACVGIQRMYICSSAFSQWAFEVGQSYC
jgi:hypothetical protein